VLALSLEWVEEELDRIMGPPEDDDLIWIGVSERTGVIRIDVSTDRQRLEPVAYLVGTPREIMPVLVAIPTGVGVAGLRSGIRPMGSL
jgi:hypothetical protein